MCVCVGVWLWRYVLCVVCTETYGFRGYLCGIFIFRKLVWRNFLKSGLFDINRARSRTEIYTVAARYDWNGLSVAVEMPLICWAWLNVIILKANREKKESFLINWYRFAIGKFWNICYGHFEICEWQRIYQIFADRYICHVIQNVIHIVYDHHHMDKCMVNKKMKTAL